MSFDIIPRSVAINLGLKRYFTGQQCKRGHVAERFVGSRKCAECCSDERKDEDRKAYMRQYRADNREKLNQQKRDKYAVLGAPKCKPRSEERKRKIREYRQKNAERIKAWEQEYRQQPDVVARRREQEALRAAEKAEWHRKDREVNAEKRNAKSRAWYAKNRDRVMKHLANKYRTNPTHKMRLLLRNRLNAAIAGRHRNSSAITLLGCPLDAFISYIEERFSVGMTWENWGEWHLDHIKPLASFDLFDEDQLREACHFTNMRPLWATDNYKKGAKHPDPPAGRADGDS